MDENLELFTSYIQKSKLDIDINTLTALIYELRDNDNGLTISNTGGWHSTDFYPLKPTTNPYLHIPLYKSNDYVNLLSAIQDAINIYHQKIGFKKTLKQVITNIWININGKGHSNELHVHPKSALSGVFYLTDSETPITFIHPYVDINTYYWPVDSIDEWNKYNSGIYNVLAEKNTLLIFPSWLFHKVPIHKSNDDRISISFNTKLVTDRSYHGRKY